jgi:hypothetical protein
MHIAREHGDERRHSVQGYHPLLLWSPNGLKGTERPNGCCGIPRCLPPSAIGRCCNRRPAVNLSPSQQILPEPTNPTCLYWQTLPEVPTTGPETISCITLYYNGLCIYTSSEPSGTGLAYSRRGGLKAKQPGIYRFSPGAAAPIGLVARPTVVVGSDGEGLLRQFDPDKVSNGGQSLTHGI